MTGSRFAVGAITLFFVTMNVLLWRSEIIGRKALSIPPRVVWNRILENEHKSTLEVRHHGRSIGFCRWNTLIESDAVPEPFSPDDSPVEGIARKAAGYTVDFDGGVTFEGYSRIRFWTEFKFGPDQTLTDFRADAESQPDWWRVHSDRTNGTVVIGYGDARRKRSKTIRQEDLLNPLKLVREFGGPLLDPVLAAFGFSFPSTVSSADTLGIKWNAWSDQLHLGSLQIPVYRLELQWLDRVHVRIFVRREGGEIIRAELPDDLILVNGFFSGI